MDSRVSARDFGVYSTRDIWQKQLQRLSGRLAVATLQSNAVDSESTRMARDVETFIGTIAAGSFDSCVNSRLTGAG